MDVKNDVFARITEPSNNDYDNDVNDNCDNNFGTFDDFGVKNDQKVSYRVFFFTGPPLKKTKSKIVLEYPDWASPGPHKKVKVHGLGLP